MIEDKHEHSSRETTGRRETTKITSLVGFDVIQKNFEDAGFMWARTIADPSEVERLKALAQSESFIKLVERNRFEDVGDQIAVESGSNFLETWHSIDRLWDWPGNARSFLDGVLKA